jgi:hypothetical protein
MSALRVLQLIDTDVFLLTVPPSGRMSGVATVGLGVGLGVALGVGVGVALGVAVGVGVGKAVPVSASDKAASP